MKNSFIFLLGIGMILYGCKKKDPETTVTPTPVKPIVIEPGKPVSFVYVANENGESVSVIDVSTMRTVTEIDLTDVTVSMVMPHNVQVAPNGKSVWVTAMGMAKTDMDQAIVIDPKTNEIIQRIYLGNNLHPAHIVLDSNCNNAFVTAYNTNKVIQIDAKTYSIVKTFDLDSNCNPHGIRYSNGKLYVANMTGKSMSIIDPVSGQISVVPLGGIAIQTATTRDGKFVFISLFDTKEVVKYDIENKTVKKISLPTGARGPVQLYATPDSKTLYVCDQGAMFGEPVSTKVFVIDIGTESVKTSIYAGRGPHGVVVSNDGKYACVTSSAENTVNIIDTKTNTMKASIPVGLNPNGIGYWYGTGGMP